MSRSVVYSSICGLIAVCLTMSVEAANKTKPSSAATEAIQGILDSEVQAKNASIDRREVLKPASRPQADPNSVWWQAGYVHSGKQWLPFEESIAVGEEASRLDEYREQRDKLSDQPHGHWQLATWCRKNGLTGQERVHLLKVLASRDATVNMESVYERLGCQKVGDSWVSPQERREASALRSEIDDSRKRWDVKLGKLVELLNGNPKQRATAEKQMAEITHSSAVPSIVALLCMGDQSLAVHGVKLLGQIPDYQASRALAGQAVFSPWKPVRTQATEFLKRRKLEEFVPDLTLLLSIPIRTKQETSGQSMSASYNYSRLATGMNVESARMNWDFAWIEETQDTIRIGIRRLFPVSTPANIVHHISNQPQPNLTGSKALGQPQGIIDGTTLALAELIEQAEGVNYSADKINESRIAMNERVGKVLSDCTSETMNSDPKFWWDWWTNFSSVAPNEKDVVIVDERKMQPNAPSFSRTTTESWGGVGHSCLVAGTPVWTERGLIAIEQILAGDRVLSKEISSGELRYKPVLLTTVREPTPVHRFDVGGDSIEASLGHHFWVSGDGWTKVREIVPQQPLHTATGMQRITSIKDEGRVEKVYNLVVADFHTYFVGKSMVLSHDVLPPSLTNVKVPGMTPR